MSERTTIWSCGGGTQSAAIAALIVAGRLPKPDLAVISDTEREKTKTWEYFETTLRPALAAVGVDLQRVPKSQFATVDLYALNGDLLLPVYTATKGRLSGFCSNEWKRRVVQRWARAQGVKQAESWIGYSLDEQKRATAQQDKWWKPRYPLIDMRLRRGDCVRIVQEIGWPDPPRSACWMCPHMSNAEWRDLRDDGTGDFQKAIVIDRLIREEDADVFLHRSGKPLDEADFGVEDLQGDLFGCDTGHCFV